MIEKNNPPGWTENDVQEPLEENSKESAEWAPSSTLETEDESIQDVPHTPWDERKELGVIEAFIDSWIDGSADEWIHR